MTYSNLPDKYINHFSKLIITYPGSWSESWLEFDTFSSSMGWNTSSYFISGCFMYPPIWPIWLFYSSTFWLKSPKILFTCALPSSIIFCRLCVVSCCEVSCTDGAGRFRFVFSNQASFAKCIVVSFETPKVSKTRIWHDWAFKSPFE